MEILSGFWSSNLNLLINDGRKESLDVRLSILKVQMKEETFYLVREDVLPDAMRKTLKSKSCLIEKSRFSSRCRSKGRFKQKCVL